LSKEIDQVHVSLGNGLIEGKCQVARGWWRFGAWGSDFGSR